jgi:hypothetical protein
MLQSMKPKTYATANSRSSRVPSAVLVIHVLAGVGVGMWCVIAVMALLGKFVGPTWLILLMAFAFIVLHAAISWTTFQRMRIVAVLIWLLLVADIALAIFVTPKAGILVFASVVLLIACYRPSMRRISYSTGRSH